MSNPLFLGSLKKAVLLMDEGCRPESPAIPDLPNRDRLIRRVNPTGFVWFPVGFLALLICGCGHQPPSSTLERIRREGKLTYGTDAEGGGPYAFPDRTAPGRVTGFEVELIGMLCGSVGPEPEMLQGQWDNLLPTLDSGRIDVVLNGYEWTKARSENYLATRPYYVFQLQLMAPKTGTIRRFADVAVPRKDGRKWRIGVLGGSAAETYAIENGRGHLETVYFNGATDAMMATKNGQVDATLQDLPAARFYSAEYPELESVGPPLGRGLYVMYLRKGDEDLRDALDRGIVRLAQTGALKRLYDRWGIWTDAQNELSKSIVNEGAGSADNTTRGWALLTQYGPTLLASAGMTIVLSVTSMPLAIVMGLLVALGRMYGPRFLRPLLVGYVELIRGTPLMLQLYVLFFLLPELGIELPALVAGIAGLAINYSAYEAEIYRAGLQAVPVGQMEAALALGMSRRMAIRRIIIPQAVRIVIPPVANDFIALFKDTSVCSVISVVELTKRYSILANSTNRVVEFAAMTAILYLSMSLPLSLFSRWFERHLAAEGLKGAGA